MYWDGMVIIGRRYSNLEFLKLRLPSWLGVGASLDGGSLKCFIPRSDIWALFDAKKRESSPQAFSNQNNLTETKKTYLFLAGQSLFLNCVLFGQL